MRRAVLACACVGLLSAGAGAQPLRPEDVPPPRDPTARSDPATGRPVDLGDGSFEPYQSRPIRGITVNGLKKTPAELVNNQIRSRANSPLSTMIVRDDVQRLNRLGRFRSINARVQPYDDGSVALIFDLVETPVIVDAEVVGNRQIPNADLAGVVSLLKDTPVDDFQIGAAKASIERLYREKGYFQATVSVDQEELEKHGILLFRVSEGERVKVSDIRFEGNKAFLPRQLFPNIKTEVAGLLESGPLDNDMLDRDVAELVKFYKDRGYLDIRADRQVTFAPNGKEAIITFLLDEGRIYTLRSVKAALMDSSERPVRPRPPETTPQPVVLSREQMAGLMSIKAGDVYSADKIRRSLDELQNAYLRLGYADARVSRAELRDETRPEVDLLVLVREGDPFLTGLVSIAGNDLTQRKVIMRELETLRPDRPLDLSRKRVGDRMVLESEDRLRNTRLFEPGSVKVTVQPESPLNPGYRDVLVEVRETNTGALGFGAGVTSDAGLIGTVSLTQRNFDWQDAPDSWGEFITGRAFRGGGQTFNIVLAPGTEVQSYTIGLTDPYVFDTDYSAGIGASYVVREYDQYDESRAGATLSIGRRFGERWQGSVSGRYNIVDVDVTDDGAAQDFFDVEGTNNLTGLGARLVRTSVDTRFRPTRGTRIDMSAERIGIFGGDYDFTKLGFEHQLFLPIDEDFLGRRTVFSLKSQLQYIPEDVSDTPLFERFYLGGRSFRGLKFRTVSPKGLNSSGEQTKDPVGGTFSLLFSPEIEKPLFQDLVAGVVFVDFGTVDNEETLDNYRLSAGFGLRLYVDALGPVPLAFDFGFPIQKRTGDEERVFSFSVDLPF